MNCQDFQNRVRELARAQARGAGLQARGAGLIDVTHSQALAHADECGVCAARLAHAQTMTQAFRAVAVADASEAAPAHVESALLAAFREHMPAAGAGESAPVVAAYPGSPFRRFAASARPVWIAAAALLLLTLYQMGMFSPARPTAGSEMANREFNAGTKVSPAPTQMPVQLAPATPIHGAPEEDTRTFARHPAPMNVAMSAGRGNTRVIRNDLPRQPARRVSVPRELAGQDEVYSDFIPLGPQFAEPIPDAGQLLRVRMPRGQLMRLGFPVEMDRAGEPIDAQLLVDDLGAARAIRFASYRPGRGPR
ncbi:MAG: hypothetical protein ACKV2V_08985 [Blastocatellia bacterium]